MEQILEANLVVQLLEAVVAQEAQEVTIRSEEIPLVVLEHQEVAQIQ